ncbi:MAG TPA: panthothenate synthetase [Chloroflexota bacterium]|nr:panthothenate synthetase [Chloroflexota bacterium]
MRILFTITIPVEPFNTLARAGVVAQKMGAILEATKPESIYFTGNGSGRGAVVVHNIEDGSQVPALGEPWLLTFNAQIEYSVAITPDELMRSGLDELVRKWA